jgi:transposase
MRYELTDDEWAAIKPMLQREMAHRRNRTTR